VTSFINTLPLKASHKPQRSVIRFLRAKDLLLSADAIHSEVHPVSGGKCFMRLAVRVWCKKFARGRESAVDEERPAAMLF